MTSHHFCAVRNSPSVVHISSFTCSLRNSECQDLLVRMQGFGVHTGLQSFPVKVQRSNSGSCVRTHSITILEQYFVIQTVRPVQLVLARDSVTHFIAQNGYYWLLFLFMYVDCQVPHAKEYSSGCKVSACVAGYTMQGDSCTNKGAFAST